VTTYDNKYICTEQGRTLTFWVPELYQVQEATKFIFITDTEGHIKIKGEADMNESITANSIHIQRWLGKVKMNSVCAIHHEFKY
jgi:hypothetical protein